MRGSPIDVAVQMDVEEFLTSTFDMLDNDLKDLPDNQRFLQTHFGGKVRERVSELFSFSLVSTSQLIFSQFNNQIICKDCPHRSENIEKFFVLPVDVKPTLEESLKAFVEGDVLEGENK